MLFRFGRSKVTEEVADIRHIEEAVAGRMVKEADSHRKEEVVDSRHKVVGGDLGVRGDRDVRRTGRSEALAEGKEGSSQPLVVVDIPFDSDTEDIPWHHP